ncbi:hypothetical protein ABFX02_13G177700 [Erythranthe guttata]
MRKALHIVLLKLMAFNFFLMYQTKGGIYATLLETQEKAEAANPATTNLPSPPEGNTTFLGGTTWCVARPGSSETDLQIALDWACGLGKSDCGPIQPGGPCFQPNTLLSHASYAFNSYYQENGNNDVACNFGGAAVLTPNNPTYAKCLFPTSESLSSSSSKYYMETSVWWKIDVILLLLVTFING